MFLVSASVLFLLFFVFFYFYFLLLRLLVLSSPRENGCMSGGHAVRALGELFLLCLVIELTSPGSCVSPHHNFTPQK